MYTVALLELSELHVGHKSFASMIEN